MNKVFEVLGLLFWFLCYTKEILYTLKNMDPKDSFFKNFKTNAISVLRLDKLLLIIIFIIYVNFNKAFVTSMLFSVICLYLFINKFYEKTKKEKNINVIKNNLITVIFSYLFALIPFIYLIITKDYDNTSIILLFYIIFSYFIIEISKKISNFLKK